MNHLSGLHILDIRNRNTLNISDRCQRNGIFLIPDNHHQSLNNGKCQRKSNRKGGSLAKLGANLNITAQLLNIGLHNIKSHTTSGNIGDLLCHGKARHKQKINDLLL